MKGEFEAFRQNVKREMKRIGQKGLVEKSGVSRPVLHLVMKSEREFRENHLEAISAALNIPLSKLFLSPQQLDLKLQEDEFMKEIQECLDLMVSIPEFKRAILSKCDELKIVFKDKVSTVKKKSTGLASTTLGRSE